MNILGSIAKISLPIIGDESFLAKVDTGADSSSIHCDDFYVKDEVLYCKILALKKILKFKNFYKKFVKSSNGEGSERYKVTLRVIVDGCEVVGKFTLNNRESMNYPVLIGKNILKKGFIVDVNKHFLEENLNGNTYRTFPNDTKSDELIWHMDKEDRIVEAVENKNWLFQMDNQLPIKLEGEIFIPKNTFHRIIKGDGDLKVKVIKLNNINESSSETYNVYYTKRLPNGDVDERTLLNKTPFKHIKGATHFAKYQSEKFKVPVDKKDNSGISVYRFTDVISILTN